MIARRSILAGIGALAVLAIAPTPASSSKQSHEHYRQRCEAWLEQQYADHRHVTTIHAYVEAKTFRYRANYDVAPQVGFPIRIGLDCEIALTKGARTIDARERPYAHTPAAPDRTSGRDRKLSYSAHGCPRLAHWKRYSDAAAQTPADARLPQQCVWIDAGTPIHGPIQTARYRGDAYVLIRLREDGRLWVPASKL